MELSVVGSILQLELESSRSCLNAHHLVSLWYHCWPPTPPSSRAAPRGVRLAAGRLGLKTLRAGGREGRRGSRATCAGRGRRSQAGSGARAHTRGYARARPGPGWLGRGGGAAAEGAARAGGLRWRPLPAPRLQLWGLFASSGCCCLRPRMKKGGEACAAPAQGGI